MEFYAKHRIDEVIKRFPETEFCMDFHAQDFYIPGIEDPAEYLRQLNKLTSVKTAREHSLDCPRCLISLDAFLISQAQPELFKGIHKEIIKYQSSHDGKRKLFVIGLPWPNQESSPQTGRLVLGVQNPLTLECGLWYFELMMENISKKAVVSLSDFRIRKKHDGKREPCYQADCHDKHGGGYASIRARKRADDVIYAMPNKI